MGLSPSTPRRPESRDAWGAVTSSEEQQAVRQELLEAFRCVRCFGNTITITAR